MRQLVLGTGAVEGVEEEEEVVEVVVVVAGPRRALGEWQLSSTASVSSTSVSAGLGSSAPALQRSSWPVPARVGLGSDGPIGAGDGSLGWKSGGSCPD